MPISPTGSLRSFRGFSSEHDQNRSERMRSGGGQRSSSRGPSSKGGAGIAAASWVDDTSPKSSPIVAGDQASSSTGFDPQTQSSPVQNSPARLNFSVTAAPNDRLDSNRSANGNNEAETGAASGSGLYLTTNVFGPSSQHQHPPSPLSAGSTGSHGHPHSTGHSGSNTPPSAVRSPGAGGGFFSILRPTSPRVVDGSSVGTEKRKPKERTVITGGQAGESSRDAKERSLADRSRKNGSMLFDHVGSVFERFGKKVHYRSDSREPPKGSPDALTGASSGGDESSLVDPTSAVAPTADQIDLLEELAAQKPPLLRNPSASSVISFESVEDGTVAGRQALGRMLIQVTEDNERFLVVDVSGLDSAAGIKERMLSKLHRFEDDPASFVFYRTEIGMSETSGPPIAEDSLWTVCKALGDNKGNLKFLLKQIGPPARPTSTGPPPAAAVTALSEPQRRRSKQESGSSESPLSPQAIFAQSNAAATSGDRHLKADSISSVSSTGDYAFQHDGAEGGNGTLATYDSGSETGRKKGLARSKGVSRRSFASGSAGSSDDPRFSGLSQATSSRPSSGLLAVREGRSDSVHTKGTTVEDEPRGKGSVHAEQHDARDPDAPIHVQGQAFSGPAEEMEELQQVSVEEERPVLPRRYSRGTPQRPATSSGYSNGNALASAARSPSKSPRNKATELDRHAHSPPSQRQQMPEDSSSRRRDVQTAERDEYDLHDAARMYNQPDAGYEQLLAQNLAGGSSKINNRQGGNALQPIRSMEDLKSKSGSEVNASRSVKDNPSSTQPKTSRANRQSVSDYLPEEMRSPGKDGRYPSLTVAREAATGPVQMPPNNQSRRPGSAGQVSRPAQPLAPLQPRHSADGPPMGVAQSGAISAVASSTAPRHPPSATSMRMASSFDGGYRDQFPGQMSHRGPGTLRAPASGVALAHNYQAQHQHHVQAMSGTAHPHPPNLYINEFGARVYTDPRAGPHSYHGPPALTPFPQRPHTFHDAGNPATAHYRAFMSPPEPKEDPYIQARFPASSTRQVSEFLRTGQAGGSVALSPGMTVQETLQHRRQSGGQEPRQPFVHPHFGPREPRALNQPQSASQWDPRSAHHHHQQQQQLHQLKQQEQREASSPHPPVLMPRSSHDARQTAQSSMPGQHAQRPSQEYHYPRTPATSSPQQGATRIVGPQNLHGQAPQYRGPPPAALPHSQRSAPAHTGGQYQQQVSSTHPRTSTGSGQQGDGHHRGSTNGGSDRSSGLSFKSTESDAVAGHRRSLSRESSQPRSSIEESMTAPTSARSSGSGPLPGQHLKSLESPPPSGGPAASSRVRNQPTHVGPDEIDVSRIRPLPRLPVTSAVSSTASKSAKAAQSHDGEDEGTLKADQWASLLANASGDSNALKPPRMPAAASPNSTVKADSPSTASSSTATVKSPSGQGSSRIGNFHLDDGGGGTFASFADDDDDDEGGTWAKPLDAAPPLSNNPSSLSSGSSGKDSGQTTSLDDADDSGTLKPSLKAPDGVSLLERVSSPSRRPELRLTIDAPNSPAAAFVKARASPHDSPALSSSSNGGPVPLSSTFSPGVLRKSSFARRDNAWAMRPPPEQLYENLDEFFPRHDLDKPVLDAAAAGAPPSPLPSSAASGSPSTTSSGRHQLTTASPTSASSLTRHKKSIRRVAEDRMRFMEMNGGAQTADTPAPRRAPVLSSGVGSLTPMTAVNAASSSSVTSPGLGLARRRSTKLWGTKLLEMTPGSEQVNRGSHAASVSGSSVAESPSADSNALPVFKWVKGDLIGKGTYGRVYLALNATTGEMIAVKQVELPRTESDREDTRQKGVVTALKSEIDTLKDLDHPNIVSYLGFEETPKYLHLFLEYVPGGSIASVLRKYGPMEEGTIKFFVLQILSGLTYLHERGVLHRDLKGDNLLVNLDGTVKISDFGTVRKSDNIYSNVEGMSLQGSVFWMAPEVVTMSKKGYSAKVDIWSLGCVVLEMLAGRRPWSDDEAVQAMFKIGKEGRAPPIPPDVRPSPEAAHFLKKCFELDPDARPTASRLLEHVFPYNNNEWSFKDTMLYKTMKNTVRNR
ncbi:Pkinase-domain-containing protein [Microstroma glucosiphilum]|uniref:Pkinase-domain-containing protein n=1 Tax=Pseudomicrostroma glucosiphilum TaxID=1684307 RepID=A0A316U0Q8_9BASI|nr:Pkinase-domain-containing protein [Pseudomicrostroma glucosiphilum]PWN18448.1 Pkinase-domain-containing protein [Pseudomicrostroma glucosiphilum]